MLVEIALCLIVGVSDGDTLTARCGESGSYSQEKIRLSAVDAPEALDVGHGSAVNAKGFPAPDATLPWLRLNAFSAPAFHQLSEKDCHVYPNWISFCVWSAS